MKFRKSCVCRAPSPLGISQRTSAAFTLIELLVVMGIIAILAAVSFGAYGMAINEAHKAQAVAAARNLVTAYLTATDPNSGQLMAGYDRTINSLPGPGGVVLSGPAAQRYPWRMGPYLGDNVPGTVLIGDVAHQIDPTDSYMVSSILPLGMNYIFVGGDVQSDGSMTYPSECITRMANSAPVIVFATACGDGSGNPSGSGGPSWHGQWLLHPHAAQSHRSHVEQRSVDEEFLAG